MPTRKRRNIGTNRYATREQRKIYIIGVEGETEREYFSALVPNPRHVKVIVLQGKNPSAIGVQETVQDQLDSLKKGHQLRAGDEAWVVIDRDDGEKDDFIAAVYSWAAKHANRFVALSSPFFEYWLLLHYEDPKGIASKKECMQRLKHHNPAYRKGSANQLPLDGQQIVEALNRAAPRFTNIPSSLSELRDVSGGFTTANFLVEKLLRECH
ncbi:RloB domain-containing protein [Corynebacterium lizhenjunii]|uniref:RloB domain-containing protein n=1 Tax=Corynebacterium lizhenjunii TaxID=2709394 RepID=A0A7T0P9V2_9CORY|nr:RloB family protein [Corynebacterium lizhenjunii]QPK79153.1 RloB domain-containing protein [Corynebacterium lizhenjunii]